MLSKLQQDKVIALYEKQSYSISEIMRMTGVGSSQTIYKILESSGVSYTRRKKQVRVISVCLDKEAEDILVKEAPRNISKWICELIKKA